MKCPPEQAKNITVHVAEYIARDLRPISTVDGGGFQLELCDMKFFLCPMSWEFMSRYEHMSR